MERIIAVYIVTNRYHTVLYTGVTGNLPRRAWQHANGEGGGFSSKNNITKLVYYELHPTMESAILREKYIKGKGRSYKQELISKMNLNWEDLRYMLK